MAESTNHWDLPQVNSIEMAREHFEPPRTYYKGPEPSTTREAVTFIVITASGLPIRALSPALFVGNHEIPNYETIGTNHYRFWEFEPHLLQPGAPISLGWPILPDQRVLTRFHYEPPDGPLIV